MTFRLRLGGVVLGIALLGAAAPANGLKPEAPAPGYDHDRWRTEPRDILFEFRAFTVSFDSADDNDGDGKGEALGVPEWVSYEIRRGKPIGGLDRPSTWFTDPKLHALRIMPNNDSYRGSGYDRGHMCQKQIASRLGAESDWNSHTLLNACPQDSDLNAGIWLDLEYKTSHWADTYGRVWVICGPIFYADRARRWIGDPGEVPVAVPDAFFKIVVRPRFLRSPEVLAFVYPNGNLPRRGPHDHNKFLTTIDRIEAVTGLDFLTILPDAVEARIERNVALRIWE